MPSSSLSLVENSERTEARSMVNLDQMYFDR